MLTVIAGIIPSDGEAHIITDNVGLRTRISVVPKGLFRNSSGSLSMYCLLAAIWWCVCSEWLSTTSLKHPIGSSWLLSLWLIAGYVRKPSTSSGPDSCDSYLFSRSRPYLLQSSVCSLDIERKAPNWFEAEWQWCVLVVPFVSQSLKHRFQFASSPSASLLCMNSLSHPLQ
jgi:hypothetical protein